MLQRMGSGWTVALMLVAGVCFLLEGVYGFRIRVGVGVIGLVMSCTAMVAHGNAKAVRQLRQRLQELERPLPAVYLADAR